MGQFLSVGILTKITVSKKGLKLSSFDNLKENLRKRGIHLSIYDGKLGEGVWSGELKTSIIEQELLEFLKKTYALIEKYASLNDKNEVLSKLMEHDVKEWPEIMEEAGFYNFQEDRYAHDYYLYIEEERVRISFTAIILKMTEKIMFESDAGLFDLFTVSLQQQLKQFKLAKALRVYVTG